MFLIFDTETTGLPKNWNAPISDVENWPRIVQLAWQLHNINGKLIAYKSYLVYPEDFTVPYASEKIHRISTELAKEEGVPLIKVLKEFEEALVKTTYIIGHNLSFDINVIASELYREKLKSVLLEKIIIDTCTEYSANLCQIMGGKKGKFKYPTLTELYRFLFEEDFEESHNASADVEATARCFFELLRQSIGIDKSLLEKNFFIEFKKQNLAQIELLGLKHKNFKLKSKQLNERYRKDEVKNDSTTFIGSDKFVHLHNQTSYSILQSTSTITKLISKAILYNMSALAITDIANMFGVFEFVEEISKYNKKQSIADKHIKPIIGGQFYVCTDRKNRLVKDNGYLVVFLAKNKAGYKNLIKIASLSYTEGFYYVPRIDREVVERYKDDLIVLSGNLRGEISHKILNTGESYAESALIWWKTQFKDDFYLEIGRHNIEEENRVNDVLVRFSKKHNVKLIATNDTYYISQEDYALVDILICIKEGEKSSTPIGKGRGFRNGFENDQHYFKSQEEMIAVFSNLPEAINNISEVVEKIEYFELKREVALPKFEIPKSFFDEDTGKNVEYEYLKHLTYKGAKTLYGETLSIEVIERIEFELSVILKTGYPGYFLIVYDIVSKAKQMDVSVGPGRGSAAGSVVAYTLGITSIDPLEYNLLFERFLNPERISMPDIDIDFEDDGREKVLNYIIEKYGSSHVAQIITYGKMAGRSAVRDTARVLELPLLEADRMAKNIPFSMSLNDLISKDESDLLKKSKQIDISRVRELKKIAKGVGKDSDVLNKAIKIEGSIRNLGVHACGIIITPDEISKLVPVANSKDSKLVVAQYDNNVVEKAGLLKMDILGLKTLTVIKDAVKNIYFQYNKKLNVAKIPLDDEKTYRLFQKGETIGVFQYESVGMQKYMKDLKPTVFDDLIAMNALYRPGPMEYIPSFIRRKTGKEDIEYDIDVCEDILKETYGITVYQEQVMLLSQKLASFTKGEADVLRKAMGKKIISLINELKPKFINGGVKNNHPKDKLEKIWKDWESFASYAFNKSHSTCYAYLAYQTAYLKANYTEAFMAAVLSNNLNDIKVTSMFLEECKRMGLRVHGPDINESYYKFTVRKQNEIRYGLGAIKGVGKSAVETIVENRKELYKSVFDLTTKIDIRSVTKKTFEALAFSGGFDSLGLNRSQYFQIYNEQTFLEKALKYGLKYQESKTSTQINMFGESEDKLLTEPTIPPFEEWSSMEKLRNEKEVVGIYLSSHPLDEFSYEIKRFCNADLSLVNDLEVLIGKTFNIAGIITNISHKISKTGSGWGMFILEDYSGSKKFRIFGEEYLKFKHFFSLNSIVLMKINIKSGWVNKETGKVGYPNIQYLKVELLHDILEKYVNELSLNIQIENLKSKNIEKVLEVFEKFPGENKVNIIIASDEFDTPLVLRSKTKGVNISKGFVKELLKEQIQFTLN